VIFIDFGGRQGENTGEIGRQKGGIDQIIVIDSKGVTIWPQDGCD